MTDAGEAMTQPGAEAKAASGKHGRKMAKIVFVISLVVLIASLAALAAIGLSYWQGQQKYGEIGEELGPDNSMIGRDGSQGGALGGLSVDWEALLKANPDTVAWLYIPNTQVNYPVVRGADNDYYLTHDFDGDQGWLANYGAIFMDYRNNPDLSDSVYFFYGHHMNDGSMFAALAELRDQQRFDECRDIYLLTPGGNYHLRSFSLVHCAASELIVEIAFDSEEAFSAYVQDKVARSVVQAEETAPVETMRKVFAFATCDNVGDGRYVLYAYVQDTSAANLEGEVGLAQGEEGEQGFVNELRQT